MWILDQFLRRCQILDWCLESRDQSGKGRDASINPSIWGTIREGDVTPESVPWIKGTVREGGEIGVRMNKRPTIKIVGIRINNLRTRNKLTDGIHLDINPDTLIKTYCRPNDWLIIEINDLDWLFNRNESIIAIIIIRNKINHQSMESYLYCIMIYQ